MTSPIRIYGLKQATCTQRVLLTLEELGLDYELKDIDLKKGEHKTPEYLKLNPFGQIPALEHNGKILFESRSLIRYIASLSSGLYNNKELVETWLECDNNHFNPKISPIIYERVFKKYYNQEPDENIIKQNLDKLLPILNIYDKHLADHEYLADTYSIADISHLPYLRMFYENGFNQYVDERPNLKRWYDSLSNKPMWKKLLIQ